MNLESHELRSFLVLSEALHFGRAASLLHISQPALSKQIKLLEEKIGGQLLTRNRRQVQLTDAGEVVYNRGRRVLRDLDGLVSAARAAMRGETGLLRVGVGLATVHSLVPPVLRKFRQQYPSVEIQVSDMSTPAQIDALLSGNLDIGFVRMPLERFPLRVKIVTKERLAIAASSKLRGTLRLKTLTASPFIMIGRDVSTTYYDHCIQLCGSAGFSPTVVHEANDMYTLLNLVRAGLGIALVPHSAVKMGVKGLNLHRIDSRDAEWNIGVAWNGTNTSPAVQNFLQICLNNSGQGHE